MDNPALLLKARSGDSHARNELVKNNSALVWSIAQRFRNRGYDLDDIFQIGCIGMIKAINRFDTGYNVKFSTYAVPLIIGEIQRFLRDDGMIKVSRSLKELAVKALSFRENYIAETGREPTVNTISAAIGSDADTVVMAMEAVRPCDYLDRKVGEDNDTFLLDKVTYNMDTGEAVIDSIALRMALEDLTPDDRRLIEMRFFEGKTQREVADEFSISQVQISRREKRILGQLKVSLSN
ncbi:MAG: SigB/SigF/SigG family RNA polymerase sigma factor [Clostridia bacterium]|nr:SigB/SigF/SigG family RNA polymerase sigma factor [Clostridia bacterium]